MCTVPCVMWVGVCTVLRVPSSELFSCVGMLNVGTGDDTLRRDVARCTAANGEDINGWLVANGWALAYTAYSKEYVATEAAARQQHVRGSVYTPDPRIPGFVYAPDPLGSDSLRSVEDSRGVVLHARAER